MKAYVTSIGEKTTKICCEQLEKYGFEVILLDKGESWIDKYKRFIDIANEDCLRIDADIIPNKNIMQVGEFSVPFTQYSHYDLYQNNIWTGNPIYYTKYALDEIKKVINTLDPSRPETSAIRNSGLSSKGKTSDLVCGLHGFFQDDITIKRAEENKKGRPNFEKYDFDLVNRLMNL